LERLLAVIIAVMRSLRPLDAAVDAVERAKRLDPVSAAAKRAVDAALPSQGLRDGLHGVWLGHALHPAVVLVPLGSWLSATALDLLPGRSPGRQDAARALVGLGLLSAGPAALAGWADWSDLHPQQQRVGLVHAGANIAAVAGQFASWRARRRGRPVSGMVWSAAALAVGGAGAYLGGHLAYRQGAAVNHAEDAPHILPESWTRLCDLADLADGVPTQRAVNNIPVFVLRRGEQVDVLYDLCSHLSGPLSDGELSGAGDELCITCPWHGSTFRVLDGEVRTGPATAPQPVLQVKIDAGTTVLVRLGEDD
jgi:nitrite reductase/ring-hydroxylating ferredoxin subunit/uncharacterized membrane protein